MTNDIRQRIRVRFRKQADLRWISHRDLARAFERMFRRAELKLRMSEGFHPKPKMSFPLALSLGFAAEDEVIEFELENELTLEELGDRLAAHAPPGLSFVDIRLLPPGAKKAQAVSMTYTIPVPAERRESAAIACCELLALETLLIERPGRKQPIDLRADLVGVMLDETGVLQIQLRVTREAGAGPREVLDALGLSDLENGGHVLTRSKVQLAS